jgi:hypothetical protein
MTSSELSNEEEQIGLWLCTVGFIIFIIFYIAKTVFKCFCKFKRHKSGKREAEFKLGFRADDSSSNSSSSTSSPERVTVEDQPSPPVATEDDRLLQ